MNIDHLIMLVVGSAWPWRGLLLISETRRYKTRRDKTQGIQLDPDQLRELKEAMKNVDAGGRDNA